MRPGREAAITAGTLVIDFLAGEKIGRALTNWRRNGAHAQTQALTFLEKTRGSQTRYWISYRLPSKHPTGHRKAQSRITKMHEPHRHPQTVQIRQSPQGRISITIGKIAAGNRPDKARQCHPDGTEVTR